MAHLAEEYETLRERGIELALISPQSREKSAQQQSRLSVSMPFYMDEDNNAARTLGIVHRYGVPLGILGYGQDTVLPTVVVTDESGKIIYVDLTDNFRIRPSVETIIASLDQAWV